MFFIKFHKIIVFGLVLSLSFKLKIVAQSVQSLCNSDIVHFSKQTYNAQYQNWDLVQDARTKFMYVANSKGLLEYDGSSWKVYEYAQNQKIRNNSFDANYC